MTPETEAEITPDIAFVKLPPASRPTPRMPVMLPAFVTTPVPPVMNMPKALPEMEPPALLVTVPPDSASMPESLDPLMLPELLIVAAPPLAKTPADLAAVD